MIREFVRLQRASWGSSGPLLGTMKNAENFHDIRSDAENGKIRQAFEDKLASARLASLSPTPGNSTNSLRLS
jgi:hypothetical protein